MIIIKMNGGLGNQMFIYSVGYALAKKYDTDLMLDDCIYVFSGNRDFLLDKYQITYNKKIVSKKPKSNKISKGIYVLKSRLKEKKISAKCTIINEKVPHVKQTISIEPGKDYYLKDGFWQSYKYFDEYRLDLKNEFKLKSPGKKANEKAIKIKNGTYCSIHVRRGDYMNYKNGSVISFQYYKDAIEKILCINRNVKFVIFSDDIYYCMEIFKDIIPDAEYVSDCGISDCEELYLMSLCRYHIIANSTFSWWGAYLGDDEGITIAPVVREWGEDYYPDNWIKLNAEIPG